jgi:hypothetical protein
MLLYLEPHSAELRHPTFISGDITALTGFSFDQVQAEPHLWERRLHPDDSERVFAALAERAESGRFSIEYRWQCADGSFAFP